MKYIPRHSQSIEIEFSVQSDLLFRATLPIKHTSSVSISTWYKKLKHAIADSHKIPLWKIKGSHNKIKSTLFDRILFEWQGGISLDMSDDITPYDCKIILHYLEGIKMSLK